MFSLYSHVIERYLIKDLKEVVFSCMAMSVPSLDTIINDIKYDKAQTITDVLPEGIEPWFELCGNYDCGATILHYRPDDTVYSSDPQCWYTIFQSRYEEAHLRRFVPACYGCVFRGRSRADCKKYKPFLTLMCPNLTIDLK